MSRRNSWIVMAALMGLAALTGASVAAAADEIVLGAAVSQTGKHAREGKLYGDAYALTADAVNRAGGVKVGGKPHQLVLELYDDHAASAAASSRWSLSAAGSWRGRGC
jgi:branched-chain amino acid transport system substrate-binding protein